MAAGTILNAPVAGYYSGSLLGSGLPYLNRTGLTQLRLRFQLATNKNAAANLLNFYSANEANAAYRPLLQITYYTP